MAFNQLTVTNPAASSYADGSTVTAIAGKQAETLVSEVHGKWFTAAYRGKVFFASTLIAGTIIPISTTTTATFALYNPIGSGINVELIHYDVGLTAITAVVGALCLGFSAVLPLAPTSLTAVTAYPAIVGGSAAASARVYSAATIVATTANYVIGNFTTTNTTAAQGLGPFQMHHEFDGKVALSPGTLVHTCMNTAAQTVAMTQTIAWAEWPV